jgi:DUF2993 family protein
MLLVLLVVAVVVLVLAVALVMLDGRCARLAQQRASMYLSTPFGHPATVRVHRRPFLTQAIRGRYTDVEVLGRLRVGEINGATLVAHLRNAYLPLRELLGGRTEELPCEHVTGRLVLPYPELARVARIPGLVLAFEGERLMASAALPVPGFSQLARITGEAQLRLAGAESVRLRIRGVSVAGIALPMVVLNQLLPTLDVPIPLPRLPYGLQLTDLQPTANGLVVDGSANAVVFRKVEDADLDVQDPGLEP